MLDPRLRGDDKIKMPTHTEQKILPYTPDQLFDLVADVERYPEFLPWCLDCRITTREKEDVFLADLIIGYKFIREKFGSRVTLNRNLHTSLTTEKTPNTPTIQVEYISGPMRYLSNNWRFVGNNNGTTTIHFDIDFEFKNAILQGLMGLFFHEAIKRMVSAFETRAQAVYSTR